MDNILQAYICVIYFKVWGGFKRISGHVCMYVICFNSTITMCVKYVSRAICMHLCMYGSLVELNATTLLYVCIHVCNKIWMLPHVCMYV